ncbi:class I SAM-dependent methyltransferase family protein [Candidatus Woesearchaeota archaeon]|nr:class I SAM-dependent methyltransferase family protein [Candidatus Woesearchaeota archaeon]
MKFRDALKNVLTKKQLEVCPTSYDVVGDIAIIEIPDELKKKERLIAQTLLDLVKHIKVVVKKHGIHKGKFRLQEYRILAGLRRKTTVHKENGVRLKLHLEKTYFSARSATERMRIASLVKNGENIVVMFSGIAPFPLVIARNAQPAHIVGIEMNPLAHQFALDNVQLNKLEDKITLVNGDVKTVMPTLGQTFDRIIMPLPKDAEDFLDDALKVACKGTIIHLYHFAALNEIEQIKEKIRSICRGLGRTIRFVRVVKAGQYSPYVFRLCFDFYVTN